VADIAIRVLRVYHAGRDPQHRARERALSEAGVDVTLLVPSEWPDPGSERCLSAESFRVVELPVRRAGNVNRHIYAAGSAIRQLIDEVRPDVLDIHEEAFSAVARQWLHATPVELPVVMYAAQNIDKRYPPPFSHYERAAHRRVAGFYPCSSQAASVLRGKGFGGAIEVLPLGIDDAVFRPGYQTLDSDEILLVFVGRLVCEKGVADAVRTLARVHAARATRLVVCGEGPEKERARELAASLGVADRVEFKPWQQSSELASLYRAAHVVFVPSRPTETWVEQFGRVIVEAQASGAVVAGYASGSIPEVAGEAGVIVPPGDLERLAAGVARVVSDLDEFAWRRDSGQEQAANHTWGSVAAGQLSLYQAALTGQNAHVALPRSPRARRATARAEFGPTASTLGGTRPFALPILRRDGRVARAVAKAIDATAELTSRA
jgi:glycosyltransferase involved in cell wall biosynthesis